MPESINLFLGFDPGGAGPPNHGGNFGWSICREVNGQLVPPATTGLARNAWDALNQVRNAIRFPGYQTNARVLAAGIDAPLFWTRTGRRTIDNQNNLGVTPMAINSLQGSVLVQGPLLVKHLRDAWGDLTITESYPRALEHLLPHTGNHQAEHEMVQRLTEHMAADPGQNHERDATICAVSAWASIHQNRATWQDLYLLECNPITPFDIPVSYWMPIPGNLPPR